MADVLDISMVGRSKYPLDPAEYADIAKTVESTGKPTVVGRSADKRDLTRKTAAVANKLRKDYPGSKFATKVIVDPADPKGFVGLVALTAAVAE